MFRTLRQLLCAPLLLLMLLLTIAGAHAAELQVLVGGAIAEPMHELAAQFERSSGHKLVFRSGTTPQLIELATRGGPFDLGVFPREVLNDASAKAQFASAPSVDIARAGLAVAVRSGAPKPDIGTPEALKRALLNAKSIASIPASATGYQLAGVYERLGITEAMNARMKAQPTPAQIVQAVVRGEAELGVFLLNVLLAPGLDVVGPFPKELQQEVVFIAAVAAHTKNAAAVQAFIDFLRTPAAIALLKAKGLNPG